MTLVKNSSRETKLKPWMW